MFNENEVPTYYAVLLDGNVSIPLDDAENTRLVVAMDNRDRFITVTDICGAETTFAISKVCAIRKQSSDVRKADREWGMRLHKDSLQ